MTYGANFTSGTITLWTPTGNASLPVASSAGSINDAGTLFANSHQEYTSAPALFLIASAPSRGSCNDSNFIYQWQQAPSATGPFSNINGATGQGYYIPTPSTPVTLYFRRSVKLAGSNFFYTPVDAVTYTYEPVTGGSLFVSGMVAFGGKPEIGENWPARGHDCDVSGFTYVWEQSVDNGATWIVIGSGRNYPANAPNLTHDVTLFRRKVTCGTTIAYSDTAYASLFVLDPGSISTNRTIAVIGKRPHIYQQPASGGTCFPSDYQYTWQQSTTNGANWVDIGTGIEYPATAPLIAGSTWIRRRISCGGKTLFSNSLYFRAFDPDDLAGNQNYTRSEEIWKPGVTTAAAVEALRIGDKQRSTTFYDALGRPFENIMQQASGTSKDMVQFMAYDAFGRQVYHYLPYTYTANNNDPFSNNGKIKFEPLEEQTNFYQGLYPNEPAYSQTVFENSPANRILKNMAPGTDWVGSGRGVSEAALVNTAADSVRIWQINSA